MPKRLFILNDPPYGTERSYNALRLARSLMGDRRPAQVTRDVRELMRPGVEVLMGEVCAIDVANRHVEFDGDAVAYDWAPRACRTCALQPRDRESTQVPVRRPTRRPRIARAHRTRGRCSSPTSSKMSQLMHDREPPGRAASVRGPGGGTVHLRR
jgi:hypothetical protein